MAKAAKQQQFDNRTELFLALIEVLASYPAAALPQIAESAEVALGTLYRWLAEFDGTVNPHINTLVKVAGALGFEILLKKAGRKPLYAVK